MPPVKFFLLIKGHFKTMCWLPLLIFPKEPRPNIKGTVFQWHRIKAKHKFTMVNLNPGDEVVMYDTLVGKAIKTIGEGKALTIDNVVHDSMKYDSKGEKLSWSAPDVSKWNDTTFNGYYRAGGKVGTANHWLVIPLVFCENRNVDVMRSALLKSLGYHTSTDFVVDTQTLVNQYKNGASTDDLLSSEIIRTPEKIKQNISQCRRNQVFDS